MLKLQRSWRQWIDMKSLDTYSPEWTLDSFNLRSYGLLLEEGRVLLSKEWYPHYPDGMIKFPGGGVKLGEGPARLFSESLWKNSRCLSQ